MLVALVGMAIVPLAAAWLANRRTVLTHALFWAALAWVAWLWNAAAMTVQSQYAALSLTGCAGIAVLGARRPGAAAWNAVVAGLFAVQLVPLAQDFLTGTSWLNDWVWKLFLGATLTVGILNYLPTRLGIGAEALFIACAIPVTRLPIIDATMSRTCAIGAALAPWAAWITLRYRWQNAPECDRHWTQFRDRFGFLWAHRVRDQFHAAAKHAGLQSHLTWMGLRTADNKVATGADQVIGQQLLAALTQRFGLS